MTWWFLKWHGWYRNFACTFPYSNPGPNPLTLKPPSALKIDTKTASNGQRKNIQAFHSLSNNKKSTQKKQQHQLFSQETKNPPNTRKTPPSNKPTYGPTNISHSENCHGTRCRLRIWTCRHGSSRPSRCWKGRRQKNHILDGEGKVVGCRLNTPGRFNEWNKWKWWWFSNRHLPDSKGPFFRFHVWFWGGV